MIIDPHTPMIKARDLLTPLCAGILAVQPASAQADPETLYVSRFIEAAALDPEWPPFLARFADRYRVLAPVRRGWGDSEDTGYGYDVATQAEDLLRNETREPR